jgi:hypothetical protein
MEQTFETAAAFRPPLTHESRLAEARSRRQFRGPEGFSPALQRCRVRAATWKRCGHPRNKANTANVCAGKPAGQCRACYRVAHRAADVRYGNSAHGRYTRDTWRAAHPLRVMLYAARYAVKLTRARIQRLDAE